jgi:DNA helicase II / ATP-dependent DNA helicase PcrA
MSEESKIDEIAREEDALCKRVVEHVKNQPKGPRRVASNEDEQLISLRDQVAESHLEDVAALVTQMQQVAAVASRRGRGDSDPVNPAMPYFGHLRLRETGRGTRDVLIGKTTYIEPRDGVRIVDWRHAPVSQLYYRYEEGASYEEEFGGREVEGEILARRTVTIDNGKLLRVSAPQGIFVRDGEDDWHHRPVADVKLAGGEGIAIRAEHLRGQLGAGDAQGQREDRHLPEIAALLDPHQFDVISKPETGLVAVMGGAGSGKTTIGVHRMAYLAYQSRELFSPDRMLVVVGTPALRDYIGQLLRALDLQAVRVVTYRGWSSRMRERNFPWLKLPYEENTPLEVTRLKTAPELLELLAEGAEKLERKKRTSAQDAVTLWAETLTDKKRLFKALGNSDRFTPLQLERAWRWCADRCPAVLEWTPDHNRNEEVQIEGADGKIEREDERATFDDEDDALLLRCYQLVRGALRSRSRRPLIYEHLFVDEAQDLAAVDLVLLSDIVSDRKSITLAGDTAQRLHLDTGFRSWDEVLSALKLDHTTVEPLRIAYRSTKEVLAFALHVLGDLAEDEPPEAPRSGAPVEYHPFPTQGAAAAFLAEALRPLFVREPRATVAILARYPEQADAYYDVLRMAEIANLRRIENYDFVFRPGVDITDIRQVKGLEYDYVILVDVNAATYPAKDAARYQLHIGATRAAHQLWVVSSGPPSPLLPPDLL